MTLAEVLRLATEHLDGKGSETPRLDAELLLGHALGLKRIELYTDFDRPLTEAELAACRDLVARRAKREPIAYILGEWGFRRLTLTVDRRALIPRPETETVVERCLALLAGLDRPRVLDVGAGSGAIALAIADEHPGAQVTAIDVSDDALSLARENAERTGLEIVLEQRDLMDGLGATGLDLVVSNPPYVAPGELAGLMPDVREYEPHLALVGDGLTGAVARQALEALRPGGALVLEVGDGQTASVAELLGKLGYREVAIARDLAGRERVVEGRAP